MPDRHVAAVILAAGKGTRLKSDLPKVLHFLAGRPMILQVLDSIASLGPEPVIVVIGPDMDGVGKAVAPHPTVLQAEQKGTGHAVLQVRALLEGFAGDVLVLYGDTPLVRAETFHALLERRRRADDPAVVVLGFRPDQPGQYGRLVVERDDSLEAIVEAADADREELAIDLCNSGVMALDGRVLFDLLDRIRPNNVKQEFYLTDIAGIARDLGRRCAVVEAPAEELIGVNSRDDLARVEREQQRRLRARAMEAGASLRDPDSVWFSFDTRLGRDVTVGQNVVFGSGVEVGDGVEIAAFCHLQGVRIGPGARIGPFARLRPGTEIGAQARIGNFVEVKASTIEAGAKVNHLSYIGDARVGEGANIGAGTITCNYDGIAKHRSDIGAGAFIGSNTALVAPVKIGEGAIVGAGSVITEDVPAEALAVARVPQKSIAGGAGRFRARRRARKG